MESTRQDSRVRLTLESLHYLTPVIVATYFCASAAVSFFLLKPSKLQESATKNNSRRNVAVWLMAAVTASYVAEAVVYILRALVQHGWWASQDTALYVMGSVLVSGTLIVFLLETDVPIWISFIGSWVLDCALEVVLCVVTSIAVSPRRTDFDNVVLAIVVIRIALLFILSGHGILLSLNRTKDNKSDQEREPLLQNHANGYANGHVSSAPNATDYGSTQKSSEESEEEEPEDRNKKLKEQQRQRLEEAGGWWGYLKGFLIFLPYVWPSDNRRIQLYLALIGLCLIFDRILNVLVPRQLGIIIDKLTTTAGSGYLPWKEVGLWLLYKWLGSRAALGLIQMALQQRVEYWSYLRLTSVAFTHVMGLSMDFHDNKDSGELIKSVEQANALNSLVELVLFETSPVIIDMAIALIYINYLFDGYFAFTLLVVGVVYSFVTYKSTSWTAKLRRDYSEKSRNESKVLYESISNWQTVSYFNRSKFEAQRLEKTLGAVVQAGKRHRDASYAVFAIQEIVMLMGQLTVSFMAAYRVSQGTAPVGNFVTLTSYWSGLAYPLWMLAYSYRHLSSNLIDAERLLQLFRTQSKIKEKSGAQHLKLTGGRVEFKNVEFAYDERKPTLKGVSFVAEAGETIALVGETGSGKSTILKLLFRFYDVTGGSIAIDGQDIRDVKLSSLREALGVVPQDPSLFNLSIMENVRYARLDATDEEVHQACKAASIHDKIMTFPDGYKTKVGERGVKLSGGELQRVAIARVLLKDPQIVLLDEATSAVDSATEAQIQEAFRKLSVGRTTFVIAHRLSTIMDAGLILVVDNGEIVERGTHQELLNRLGGQYVKLWSKQSATRAKGKPKPSESGTSEAGSADILIDDLPPSSTTDSTDKAKSTALDSEVSLIDQVDGQMINRDQPSTTESHTGSSGIRKRIDTNKPRFHSDPEIIESDPRTAVTGNSDTRLNPQLQLIPPHPKYAPDENLPLNHPQAHPEASGSELTLDELKGEKGHDSEEKEGMPPFEGPGSPGG